MSVVSDRTPNPGAAQPPNSLQLRGGALRRLRGRWNDVQLPVVPARSDWPPALRRARTVGLLILLVEFIGFCIWSQIEVSRFALSADFGAYLQGAYLFGHGHLNPEATSYFRVLVDGHPQAAWGNAGEFFMAPLGILYRIWPHVVVLKWAQDLALVAAQAVAFTWMCELVAARRDPLATTRSGVWLLVLGLILLVANPWFIWASSFDIHSEPFAVPFVVAVARDLYYGRRRAWLWAICGIGCSAVGTSYVVATSLSSALTGRRRARLALSIAGLGILWFIFLKAAGLLALVGPDTFKTILNGGAGSQYGSAYVRNGVFHYTVGVNGSIKTIGHVPASTTYGLLLHTIVTHPFNVIKALWVNHANMWGTTSAAGLIGLVWLPVTLPTIEVLAQGGFVRGFSLPSFQNIVTCGLVSVGTIAVLIWLARRVSVKRRWIVAVLGTILGINTLIWGITWFPKVPQQWLNVITPQAASEMSRIQKQIGPNDEVVASQGVVGAFGARPWAYSLNTLPSTYEVAHGRKVWFIMSPYQGIETLDPEDTLSAIDTLSHHAGVRLVSDRDGIWLFEWNPPRSVHQIVLSTTAGSPTPGWAVPGASGNAVKSGPQSQWHVTNTGNPGYVLDQAYWREPAGLYHISVKISASAPTNVEIWNATTSRLLKRVVLHNTHGAKVLTLPVKLGVTGVQPVINGWGIWSIAPILRAGYSLELRIWTAGRARTVNVYSATLRQAVG